MLLLVGIPLGALLWAGFAPEPDPLTGVAPGWFAIWRRAGGATLVLRSLGLAVGVVALALPAGTLLAWAEQRWTFVGRRALTVATLLPLGIPSYVLAAVFARELGPAGVLPLFDQVAGLPAATVAIALVTTPYVQLVVGAALRQGSAAEEEAARSLGATRWRIATDVILPRLRNALGYSGLLAMLYALADFGAVAVLDAPVLTWRLYQAVAGQDLPQAALLGVLLVLAAAPLFVIARMIQGSARSGQVANPRPAAPVVPGGAGLAATLGVAAFVVGLGVVLPVVTLVGWTWEGVRRGLVFAPLLEPLLHTLYAAGIGTVVTLVCAVLPALVVGGRQRNGGIDVATYATSALPGVLLAFGWVLAALAFARMVPGQGLYGAILSSGLLLWLGYAARYLAEVYTPLKTAIWSFDRRLVQSHRALAAPSHRFVRRVGLPQVAPSVAAAAVLGFLALLKELPVTLLLGGATGLNTLAFRVWDRYNEALWHDAGAAGLTLVGLALVGVVISLRWRG